MCAVGGGLRPHWQEAIRAFEELGGAGLEKCRQEARRLFRENGVGYTVHGDPQGRQRVWELDPIPLILSGEDWSAIEEGLIQRVELMNLILTDLYGERRLVQQGLLPGELIFGHEGFLRACHGYRRPEGMQVIDFAVDLARGPDGRMWVLRDYAQSPAGIGYALENRTVMTRILPQFFQDGRIHRMSYFFRTLRAGLARLPSRQKDQPRIVVLTPGPYNELYFEHAYLASYLGYPLVQGDDLTVRDDRVWLKTLDGLQPVDVIIRRLNDRFCDPLELAEDSLLGVAGLLQAARMGHVEVVNPIGSGVLENPGLIPFLPGIARHFFGTDLKLPAAATWWCGQPSEREYVLEHLDTLIIKPVYRGVPMEAVIGSRASRKQLEETRRAILAHPHRFVGQEQVGFSTVPCLIDGQLAPRPAALRTFVTSSEGRYHVMRGGLARAARDREAIAPSRHLDNVNKDAWVLAEQPEPHLSLWLQSPSEWTEIERSGMLASRAAENLFWTGRYAERTEGTARLLRTVLFQMNRAEESSDGAHQEHVRLLQGTLSLVTDTLPGFLSEKRLDAEATIEELRRVMADEGHGGSLARLLDQLIAAAYMVRDRWSLDNWRILDGIKSQWRKVVEAPRVYPVAAEHNLDQLIMSLAAFMGLNMESMTREPGWLMLDSGRRIERGLWLIRTIKALLLEPREQVLEHLVLESFLSMNESLITHRRRYRSYLQMSTVLDVILCDASNPRALAYQVERLRRNLKELPRHRMARKLSREERSVLEASTRLKLADPAHLSAVDPEGGYVELAGLLEDVEGMLLEVSEALTEVYFSHTQGARQLSPLRKEVEG